MRLEEQMQVRQANLDDADSVLRVLSEAAEWLLERGIKQWPRRFNRDQIGRAIEGQTYVACIDHEIAGTFSLQDQDPDFWPRAPADALYLHRVAVIRRFAGLGRLLVASAERRALAEGKTYLRLDCWKQNRRLCDYYEDLGYSYKGKVEVTVDDRPFVSALYQKLLTRSS